MRIEHVAMYVNDLKAAKNFFEKYLGARDEKLLGDASRSLRK